MLVMPALRGRAVTLDEACFEDGCLFGGGAGI